MVKIHVNAQKRPVPDNWTYADLRAAYAAKAQFCQDLQDHAQDLLEALLHLNELCAKWRICALIFMILCVILSVLFIFIENI